MIFSVCIMSCFTAHHHCLPKMIIEFSPGWFSCNRNCLMLLQLSSKSGILLIMFWILWQTLGDPLGLSLRIKQKMTCFKLM